MGAAPRGQGRPSGREGFPGNLWFPGSEQVIEEAGGLLPAFTYFLGRKKPSRFFYFIIPEIAGEWG